MITNLPNKNKLIKNLFYCNNPEEKYLYIISLGKYLTSLPNNMRTSKYIVNGCQSKVWIAIEKELSGNIKMYGDSDTVIIKGLISIVFILYQKLTPKEIISYDIEHFFKKTNINEYLTISRSQGLETIVKVIHDQVILLQ